jgi:hypothetical protein
MLKRHWSTLALGCAILASTLLLIYLGRGLTPLVDQWGYIYAYRSWSLETLLTPHNGHLMALSILLYKAMFGIFGLESQLPYQIVNLALSGAVAALLFALIRNRVGDLLALAAAVLLLFYGAGADVILPTFAYPNLIGLAFGLAALLALRRDTSKGDLGACLLLTLSVASYSVGIVFVVGAAAAIALRPPGRRLRRCWVFLLPLVAYVAWALWARKFGQQHLYVHNLKIIGSALVDQASAVLSGITGLFTTPNGPPPTENPVPIRMTWGPVLVAGLAVLAYLRLRRAPKPGPGAIVAAVLLLTSFLLIGIALNEFRNTFDTRFVYLGSVLMLLAVAELLAPYRPTRAALIGLAVVFVFSMCANVAELGDVAQSVRAQSSATRARLAAVEIAGPAVDESVAVEDPPGAMNFSVREFHELDADFGLPAYSQAELEASAPGARQIADEELVRIMRIEPEPVGSIAPPPSAPALDVAVRIGDPAARRRGSCALLVVRGGAKTTALIRFGGGGVAYRSSAPVEASIGRFADLPATPLPAREGAARIVVRPSSSRVPWAVGMAVSAPTLVCPVGA